MIEEHPTPHQCECPVPVGIRVQELVLTHLPVPVDGIWEEPRPEAQRSSRRGPFYRRSTPACQVRSGQVEKQVSQGLSGVQVSREECEDREEMAGARSTRASDGMRCRSYTTAGGHGHGVRAEVLTSSVPLGLSRAVRVARYV